jgi:hypothetical protein
LSFKLKKRVTLKTSFSEKVLKEEYIVKHNKVFFITILGLLLIAFISGCTNVPMIPPVEKELDDASGISIIEIAGPSLSANPNIVAPGGKVTVNFSGLSSKEFYFIRLYLKGTSNNYQYLSSQFINRQSMGSKYFYSLKDLGQYEFRLFHYKSYAPLTTSNTISVKNDLSAPTPSITPTPTPSITPTPTPTNNSTSISFLASPVTVAPGETITVNFSGLLSSQAYWIRLYVKTANNYQYLSAKLIRGQNNGSQNFNSPNNLGQYEFRLFKYGISTPLLTSNIVTVQNAVPKPTPTPTPSPLVGSSPTPTPTPNPSINYQLISQYSYGKNNVVRWKNGVIKVKDSTNYPGINVQDVLNQWNSIIGGTTTFQLSTDSTSPITIFYDAASITSQGNGVWGYATVWWSNYQLIKAEIRVLPEGNWYGYPIKPKYELYLHEFGHVAGFAGHTNDGSVMDAIANGSTTISSTTRTVINGLYSLPIGYALSKSPYKVNRVFIEFIGIGGKS